MTETHLTYKKRLVLIRKPISFYFSLKLKTYSIDIQFGTSFVTIKSVKIITSVSWSNAENGVFRIENSRGPGNLKVLRKRLFPKSSRPSGGRPAILDRFRVIPGRRPSKWDLKLEQGLRVYRDFSKGGG